MRSRHWLCGAGVVLVVLSLLAWAGGSKAEAQVITLKFAH
jgi:hypothetical protein